MRTSASAHAGFTEWLLQRVTAVYLGGFLLYLFVRLLVWPIETFAAWREWFACGSVRLAWALAIASLLVHAWIGMRSVYLDYVKPLWLRFSLQMLTAIGIAGLALWAAQILIEAAR